MAFAILCLGLWALLAFKVPMDTYGWLMVVATAWFLGFVDAQFFKRWDANHKRVLTAASLKEDDTPLFDENNPQ